MIGVNWIKKLIDSFYGIFMSNTMFLLSNIPLILMLFARNSLIEIYFASLLTCPAITALYYTMGKFFRYEDISVIKNYIKGYKSNFLMSIKIGLLLNTPIMLIAYSLFRAATPFYYLQVIFVICLLMMMLYTYPLLSRYHITVKNLLVLSFISILKQVKSTLAMIILLFMMVIITLLYTSLSVLFAFSIFAYMSIFLTNSYLESYE